MIEIAIATPEGTEPVRAHKTDVDGHNTIKSLVSRVWKNEDLDLDAGRYSFDETVLLHVSGTVTKHADQMTAPTVSIPLILPVTPIKCRTPAIWWSSSAAGINTCWLCIVRGSAVMP